MSQILGGGNNSSGLATVDTLTGNSGGAVGPDSSNNINILGTGAVTVTGDASTHTLTVAIASGGFTYAVENTSFAAAAQHIYLCTAALTATLPASPSAGDTIIFGCATGSSVVVQANTGQTIRIGNVISTSAGTATANTIGNSITLIYAASVTSWISFQTPQGTWTVST